MDMTDPLLTFWLEISGCERVLDFMLLLHRCSNNINGLREWQCFNCTLLTFAKLFGLFKQCKVYKDCDIFWFHIIKQIL